MGYENNSRPRRAKRRARRLGDEEHPAAAAQLPVELVLEILARLPLRSIARFRAVCRSWHAHINHVAPRSLLAVVSTQETETPGGGVRTVVRFDRFRDRVLLPGASCPRSSLYAVSFTSARRFMSAAVGSWDGVICMERRARAWHWLERRGQYRAVEYMLCDPFTKACAVVPGTGTDGRLIGAYAHPATWRFHLLHMSGEPGDAITCRILAVGDAAATAGWRQVDHGSNDTLGDNDWHRRVHVHFEHGAVSLHVNLHWPARRRGPLPQQYDNPQVLVAVFDTAREELRVTKGPPTRAGIEGGARRCALSSASLLAMWVLEDYYAGDAGSWRLARQISLLGPDGARRGLAERFAMATEVAAVDEGDGSEEIVLHLNGLVTAYSFRHGAWASLRLDPSGSRLVAHTERVFGVGICFGEAARVLPERDVDGQRCYCLD